MLLKWEQDEKKQDLRVRRTRQALQQALMDLLKQTSFDAITVNDIAERARINRVTFYAHYEDKYDLLEHMMQRVFKQRLEANMANNAALTPENLVQLVEVVCGVLAELNGHCVAPHGKMKPLMEEQIKNELYHILCRWLAPSASKSKRRPTAEQTAMVAAWAIYGAAVQWTREKQTDSLQNYVRQVLPLIQGSLALPN